MRSGRPRPASRGGLPRRCVVPSRTHSGSRNLPRQARSILHTAWQMMTVPKALNQRPGDLNSDRPLSRYCDERRRGGRKTDRSRAATHCRRLPARGPWRWVEGPSMRAGGVEGHYGPMIRAVPRIAKRPWSRSPLYASPTPHRGVGFRRVKTASRPRAFGLGSCLRSLRSAARCHPLQGRIADSRPAVAPRPTGPPCSLPAGRPRIRPHGRDPRPRINQ